VEGEGSSDVVDREVLHEAKRSGAWSPSQNLSNSSSDFLASTNCGSQKGFSVFGISSKLWRRRAVKRESCLSINEE
jgi:hypothetical protein